MHVHKGAGLFPARFAGRNPGLLEVLPLSFSLSMVSYIERERAHLLLSLSLSARERAESSLYSLYPNKRQRSRRYIYSSVFGLRQSLVLFTSLLATATTRFTHDKLALTRSRGLQCRGLRRWGRRPAGQEGRRCTINHLSSLSYFYYERHGRNTVCDVHHSKNKTAK